MKAVFENGCLKFRRLFTVSELPASEIVWAYVQQEDVRAVMCCATASFEIGRLIVLTSGGKKEVFQYEGTEEPLRLLEALKSANPAMASGCTPENRERFGNI